MRSRHTQKCKLPLGFELHECVAKTISKDPTKAIRGVNVIQHCVIVGEVAKELISRHPLWLQKAFFPKGSELIVASHDIGKISPGFQQKIYDNLKIPINLTKYKDLDKNIGWHGAVGQSTIICPKGFIPRIIGRHHGESPTDIGLPNDEKYGGENWQKLREKFLINLKNYFKSNWPKVTDSTHADILSGLTSVADWIGSGHFFDNTYPITNNSIKKAVDKAGFVKYSLNKNLSFQNIFNFKTRKAQSNLIEAVKTPGVYILESPTGSGKTEAALYAAYKALEQGWATGIYFALPTQLTSNKIIERVNKFLLKILEDNSPHKQSLLLHSSAWLKNMEMGGEGAPNESWFNSNKRGLLAPFAVGTLDQILMAVMHVKHGFVRTFGLAGKVIIIDEVHSYDSYTGTLLDNLITILKSLKCTVIVLSATLTNDRRNQILGIKKGINEKKAYPIISSLPNGQKISYKGMSGAKDWNIKLKITKRNLAIEEALLRAEQGQQVLWVENSVSDAQDVYQIIGARAKEMGIKYGLLHSRFLKFEREKNEQNWVNLYGKSGQNTRKEKGRILIGTQVVEQSLDIDADFLVTKLCPIDMTIQRFGRLWRHRENDKIRPKKSCREAWIVSPSLSTMIKKPDIVGKSVKIYPIYVLCRSLEVLMKKSEICLPSQTRNLIEDTYIRRSEKGDMKNYEDEIKKRREELKRFALIGVSSKGCTFSEDKIPTRYSDIPYVEVLLFKKRKKEKNGIRVTFLNDKEIFLPHSHTILSLKEKIKISVMLSLNTVKVPEYHAPEMALNQINWLKNYTYIGDGSTFRVARITKNGDLLDTNNKSTNKKFHISYSTFTGYSAHKK